MNKTAKFTLNFNDINQYAINRMIKYINNTLLNQKELFSDSEHYTKVDNELYTPYVVIYDSENGFGKWLIDNKFGIVANHHALGKVVKCSFYNLLSAKYNQTTLFVKEVAMLRYKDCLLEFDIEVDSEIVVKI